MERIFACIDLKSFYASVECVDRKLDPLNTNLVVADRNRTEKTICLAVTPSLKQYGLKGRARLFEVVQKIKEVNYQRKKNNNYHKFIGKSYLDSEIKNNNNLEISYIIAPPRMRRYMEYSTKIYNIYLKYLAPEDVFVYSIDEVFCDLTNYLNYYKLNPQELITKIIKDVYDNTGITATAGIGTNMYLAKVCMDIVAKHAEANEFGVRLDYLDEMKYRRVLWNHRPLTDFWRIGPGIAKKLEQNRMYTMGDVARCSIKNEDLLYKLFGVNAELIIDHAWGYEPTIIEDVRDYKPESNSLSSGQVLHTPYNYLKTRLIIKEMIELLSLDLVNKHVVTNQLVMTIGYDIENLTNPEISRKYFGEVTVDQYGRLVPKHSHGTINIPFNTSSTVILTKKCLDLFDRIINKELLVRRVNICACNLKSEDDVKEEIAFEQLDLFSNSIIKVEEEKKLKEQQTEEKELQRVILNIKNKYGSNAILKGMNLEVGATTIDRNKQVGGHQG